MLSILLSRIAIYLGWFQAISSKNNQLHQNIYYLIWLESLEKTASFKRQKWQTSIYQTFDIHRPTCCRLMPRMLITDFIRVKVLCYLFVKKCHLRHQLSKPRNKRLSKLNCHFFFNNSFPKYKSHVHFAENGLISKTLLKINFSRVG